MAAYDKTRSVLTRIHAYCSEIEVITERFGRSYETYLNDSVYRHACSMIIMQIGELASRLPEDFCMIYNEIPWKKIRGMRNLFAHDYEKTSDSITWATIETSIPEIKLFCKKTLRDMELNKDIK